MSKKTKPEHRLTRAVDTSRPVVPPYVHEIMDVEEERKEQAVESDSGGEPDEEDGVE